MAANGKDMLAGAELYLEEIKYQAAGRKIELIVEDDEANPAVGLTKSRKLIEKDGVHLMTGGLMASTAYAIAPYIDSKEIPMTYPIMSADDITQRRIPKWIVRTGWSSSQPHQPFGEYAYNVLKFKKVSIVAYDFAFGWECASGFHKTFEDAGGKVLQKIWVPMTAQDMSPYLSQISKDADAVFAVFSGRLTLQFVKQYKEFGLKDKIPLIGGGTVTDEHALPSMGDEALGIITPLIYSEALDNPANKKFVKAFRAKAKKAASYYFRGHLFGDALDRRGHQSDQRGCRGSGEDAGGPEGGRAQGPPPRADETGPLREPAAERLRPQGRTGKGRAAEHGDPHLSERFPVLEVQARGFPEADRVFPRVSPG